MPGRGDTVLSLQGWTPSFRNPPLVMSARLSRWFCLFPPSVQYLRSLSRFYFFTHICLSFTALKYMKYAFVLGVFWRSRCTTGSDSPGICFVGRSSDAERGWCIALLGAASERLPRSRRGLRLVLLREMPGRTAAGVSGGVLRLQHFPGRARSHAVHRLAKLPGREGEQTAVRHVRDGKGARFHRCHGAQGHTQSACMGKTKFMNIWINENQRTQCLMLFFTSWSSN